MNHTSFSNLDVQLQLHLWAIDVLGYIHMQKLYYSLFIDDKIMDKALIVNSKEKFSQLAGKPNIEKQRRKSYLAVSFTRVDILINSPAFKGRVLY